MWRELEGRGEGAVILGKKQRAEIFEKFKIWSGFGRERLCGLKGWWNRIPFITHVWLLQLKRFRVGIEEVCGGKRVGSCWTNKWSRKFRKRIQVEREYEITEKFSHCCISRWKCAFRCVQEAAEELLNYIAEIPWIYRITHLSSEFWPHCLFILFRRARQDN